MNYFAVLCITDALHDVVLCRWTLLSTPFQSSRVNLLSFSKDSYLKGVKQQNKIICENEKLLKHATTSNIAKTVVCIL